MSEDKAKYAPGEYGLGRALSEMAEHESKRLAEKRLQELADEQIWELVGRVTPGPWSYLIEISEPVACVKRGNDALSGVLVKGRKYRKDAEFMALSRSLVPELIQRARKAESDLANWIGEAQEWKRRAELQNVQPALSTEQLEQLNDALKVVKCNESGAADCETCPANPGGGKDCLGIVMARLVEASGGNDFNSFNWWPGGEPDA